MTTTDAPLFELTTSRQFVPWLIDQQLSLGFSTYNAGKVFLLGSNAERQLSVFERTFPRPMGMYATGNQLWLSSLFQLHRFNNALAEGQLSEGYDCLYTPQVSSITGDLDIHDIAIDGRGQPVFVNTLFSCLATTSESASFRPLWQPHFITALQAEDRCHLNGLAMRDGEAAYVTAVSKSNVAEGWREHRHNGGLLMDVASNEMICADLSMPHSPRWHQDTLWLANSGTGEFGRVDIDSGKFEPIAFCPGYIRGVAMHKHYAIVGLSRPRHNKTFSGLALDERLQNEGVSARCGLMVIDLKTGGTPYGLYTESFITELYDVIAIPEVTRPSMVGFQNDQVQRIITIDQSG